MIFRGGSRSAEGPSHRNRHGQAKILTSDEIKRLFEASLLAFTQISGQATHEKALPALSL